MRLLAALILACLFAGEAHGATYYLRSGGSNSNDGLTNTDGGAWQTLSKANATLVAGDVVQVISLTAADTVGADTLHQIHPVNEGTAGTGTGGMTGAVFITYIGNPASPVSFGLSTISLQRRYLSVKGFRSRLDTQFYYVDEAHKPVGDSVSYCHTQTVSFEMAKSCTFAHSTVRNTTGNRGIVFLSNNLSVGPPYEATYCSICDHNVKGDDADCHFTDNVVNGGTISNPGQDKFFYMRYAHRDSVLRNQFSATFSGSSGDLAARYFYNSQNNVFADNKWTFEASVACPGGSDWNAFSARDSFSYNYFQRDTMLCGVSSGYLIGGRLINSGNANWSTTNRGDRWTDCFYKCTGKIWFQTPVTGMFLLRDVLYSQRSRGLEIQTGSAVSVHHCTIVGNATSDFGAAFSAVNPTGISGCSFFYNVFYSDSLPSISYERGLGYFNTYTGSNILDYNVYYSPKGATPAVNYLHAAAAPGSSGFSVGSLSDWCKLSRQDCSSVWGSPRFTDSTFATFNPTLLSAGYAFTSLGEDGYAGAVLPVPLDVIAPDTCVFQVSDATALNSSRIQLMLQWVNTGDDHLTGQATDVAIAYSTNADPQPTPSTFDALTVWSGVPDEPGSTQAVPVVLTRPVHTLFDYYFVLRIRDEAGNAAFSYITY